MSSPSYWPTAPDRVRLRHPRSGGASLRPARPDRGLRLRRQRQHRIWHGEGRRTTTTTAWAGARTASCPRTARSPGATTSTAMSCQKPTPGATPPRMPTMPWAGASERRWPKTARSATARPRRQPDQRDQRPRLCHRVRLRRPGPPHFTDRSPGDRHHSVLAIRRGRQRAHATPTGAASSPEPPTTARTARWKSVATGS